MVIKKDEVSKEGVRPPVPSKAKRRHAGIVPDNLVQLSFVSKVPNLKDRGTVTKLLVENIHSNIDSLTYSGVGEALVVKVESESQRIIKPAGNLRITVRNYVTYSLFITCSILL